MTITNESINHEEKNTLMLKMFRKNNNKIFNYRTMSKMTGFSLGKISNIFKKG